MAGEPKVIKTAYVAAPIDGVNLSVPPNQMGELEARQLDNYYPLEWGIRQRSKAVLVKDFGSAFPFEDTSLLFPYVRTDGANLGSEAMLAAVERKVYRFNSKTDAAPTDITGAASAATRNMQYACIFNDYIFLSNGVDTVAKMQISTAGNLVAHGFTGSWTRQLIAPAVFKERIYWVEEKTAKVHYGGVGAIAGALSVFDFAQILHKGGYISFVTGWSYNQGIGSEELFIAVSNLGEVLVYSGDYPASTNWQLMGRTTIPRPVGSRCHLRLGQELYIGTMRGLVAMSQVFAGNIDHRYYLVSNKLGADVRFADTYPSYNQDYPFIYLADAEGKVVWVLNYERGAWSRFTYRDELFQLLDEMHVTATGVAFGSFWVGTGTGDREVHRFDDFQPEAASGNVQYVWKTPFLGFGDGFTKSSKHVRIVAREVGNAGVIRNRVSIAADFKNTDEAGVGAPLNQNQDFAEATAPVNIPYSINSDWLLQELRPSGNGRTLSYIFSFHGEGEVGEISGFEASVEVGGAY